MLLLERRSSRERGGRPRGRAAGRIAVVVAVAHHSYHRPRFEGFSGQTSCLWSPNHSSWWYRPWFLIRWFSGALSVSTCVLDDPGKLHNTAVQSLDLTTVNVKSADPTLPQKAIVHGARLGSDSPNSHPHISEECRVGIWLDIGVAELQ